MKKLAILLSMLLMLSLCLVSCGTDNVVDTPPEQTEEAENLIYNEHSKLYFVFDSDALTEDDINRIIMAFIEEGISIEPRSVDAEPAEHEIVIGNVGREVSDTAYDQLDRIEVSSDVDLRYLVYSNGSSIALAYEEDREGYCLDKALELLLENYVKDELILSRGPYDKTAFNLYDYLAEVDAPYYQDKWANIAQAAGTNGKSLVTSLQGLYSLYNGENLISWLANLYDTNICVCSALSGVEGCTGESPLCGSGGFYYSNSARDNYGFLPDAESTVQALGFLGDCGINAGLGGGYVSVVPEWMAEQIVDFIYNLQDADGYFYHPQWGKAIGDSRSGRDLNWCNNILKAFGVQPKYTTPSDSPSVDEISQDFVTGRLGRSSVSAVSKVVATAGDLPAHLQSLKAFKNYVIGLDFYNKSYNAGHTISSQLSQIKAADTRNGNTAYADFVISHMNEVKAFYGNGTWHSEVNYFAVNGIMKISGVYSGLGREIPDAEATCRASFKAVMSEETTSGVVDIWNAWEAVSRVLNNIRDYSEGGAATAAELAGSFFDEAPEAIDKTREKLSEYIKNDGSFSYTKLYSSETSQGVQAAVPNSVEGDVNATVIATNYMIDSIFASIGLSSYSVTICRTRERAIFYDIIEDLSPVVKGGDGVIVSDPIDFEYEDIGDATEEVTVGTGATGTVVADPRGEGKVLHYLSSVNAGEENKYNNNFLTINNMGVGQRAQIFEGDFCFDEALNTNDAFRIEIGRDGDSNNCYRILFRKSGNGRIELWESSASALNNAIVNDLGVSVAVGEWFSLRIEYYKGDHNTVRIKVYFNDKLCAVSDNYYDNTGIKLSGEGTPKSDFRLTRFYSLNKERVSVLMDNLLSYVCNDAYIASELHEDYAQNPYAINADKVYESSEVYDFEGFAGEDYPDRLTVNKEGIAAVRTEADNSSLALSGGSSVYVPVMKLSRDANCSVFSFKVDASGAALGEFAKISLAERNKTNKTIIDLYLAIASEGGVNYAIMKDSDGKILSGVKIPVTETFEIRIDFYEKEKVALIYVNGEVRGLTAVLSADAKVVRYSKAIVTSIGSGEILIDDLSANRTAKDYAAATTPKYDGKTYDFEEGLDGVTVSGGAALESGKLVMDSSKDSLIKIPVNDRDDVVSMTTFAFDFAFTSMVRDGATHKLAITDDAGNTLISLVIYLEGKTAKLYEVTALGTHKQPILTFDTSKAVSLKLEYYEVDKICKVYLDGRYSTETSLVYSAQNAKLTPAFATLSSMGTASRATFDNISLDRINKLYSASTTAKPESSDPTITFDYASGNNYSDNISSTINSAASKPAVVEVNKNGEPDKALRFETLIGNSMDILGIEKTVSMSTSVSQIFELDFMLESGKDVPFQVWFNSGSKVGMQMNIHVKEDQSIYFAHGNAKNVSVDTGIDLGQWIKLRVETYFVDGNILAKVYVNDALLYTVRYYDEGGSIYALMTLADGTSLEPAITTNNEQLVAGVSSVQFRALKAAEAVAYLDNISLMDSAKPFN